jgi:hypothetical protein
MYRLDFIEVAPRLVGRRFGVAALAITAASRALELGAGGLVLGSTKGARRAYEVDGGHQITGACPAYNWNARASLVPFHFGHGVLIKLRRIADASRTA